MRKEGRREFGNAGPVVTSGVGRGIEEIAPGSYVFDDVEQVKDLEGFEGGAVDARFFERIGGIEEAGEAEAAASGEHRANLCGALLLLVDPGEIGGRVESEGPGSAKGRGGAGGDVVAKAWPLKGLGAGFGEPRRDGRQ